MWRGRDFMNMVQRVILSVAIVGMVLVIFLLREDLMNPLFGTDDDEAGAWLSVIVAALAVGGLLLLWRSWDEDGEAEP